MMKRTLLIGCLALLVFEIGFAGAVWAQAGAEKSLLTVICGTAPVPGNTPGPGAIPEPSTLFLVGSGMLLGLWLRKRIGRKSWSWLLILSLGGGSLFLSGQTFPPANVWLLKPGSGGGVVTIEGYAACGPTCLKTGLEYVAGRVYTLRATPAPEAVFGSWQKNRLPVTSPVYVGPGDRITADFRLIPPKDRAIPVTLRPDGVFAGEAEAVTVTADLSPKEPGAIERVELRLVDVDGNVLEALGELTDDGNPAHGDERAGDGIFSFQKMLAFPAKEHVYLNVLVSLTDQPPLSQTTTLPVFEHLTDAEFNGLLQVLDQAKAEYLRIAQVSGEEEAIAQTQAFLRNQADVIEAGKETPGQSIWVLYGSGILGGLHLPGEPGTRQGGRGVCVTPPCPTPIPVPTPTPPPIPEHDPVRHQVGNKEVFLASPVLNQAAPANLPQSTEPSDIIAPLQSYCQAMNISAVLIDDQATIAQFKTLSQHGLILIASHGDIAKDQQYQLLTGEKVLSKEQYQEDVKAKRLAIMTEAEAGILSAYYWLRPSFISNYAAPFYPNSLVVFSTCHSAENNSMADEFLANGAKTYLGFTDVVSDQFGRDTAVEFFTEFLKDGNATTGDAYALKFDNLYKRAWWRMLGSDSLQPPACLTWSVATATASTCAASGRGVTCTFDGDTGRGSITIAPKGEGSFSFKAGESGSPAETHQGVYSASQGVALTVQWTPRVQFRPPSTDVNERRCPGSRYQPEPWPDPSVETQHVAWSIAAQAEADANQCQITTTVGGQTATITVQPASLCQSFQDASGRLAATTTYPWKLVETIPYAIFWIEKEEPAGKTVQCCFRTPPEDIIPTRPSEGDYKVLWKNCQIVKGSPATYSCTVEWIRLYWAGIDNCRYQEDPEVMRVNVPELNQHYSLPAQP